MKIDPSKFIEYQEKHRKELEQDAQETEPERGVQVYRTMGYHKMRRVNSEVALNQVLPRHFSPGDIWHCISQGDVDSLTYLRVIVKQQRIRYLLISTWCMASTDIQEISGWVDAGYIDHVDFYVGEIFTSRYAAEFTELKALCARTGGRVALFRNHSKIMAGFGDQFDFAIESSANVNTNPRCEQATISIDSGLARFYKDFFDGIKSYDHSFDDWSPVEV